MATTENQVSWEQHGATSFTHVTAAATVLIESEDGDGMHPFALSIIDEQGAVIEELSSRVTTRRGRSALGDLYHAARRQVFSVDTVLEKLLEELPEDPGAHDEDPPF